MAEVPDEEKYGFEALFRARVRDEQAGFEQCRDILAQRVSQMFDERYGNEEPPSYMEWDHGYWSALEGVLRFLRGTE